MWKKGAFMPAERRHRMIEKAVRLVAAEMSWMV